ncbi:DUF2057 domain-containing protein [Vibrio sp.]|nr:DUF2057 domain-containing protein [Vibrio sp.]
MKSHKRFAFLIPVLGFAFGSFSITSQAASVQTSSSIELLALDGAEVEASDAHNGIQLQQGKHQVVFRYYGNVRKGSQKSVVYSSLPYVAEVDLKQDDTLNILAPRLSVYSQAEAYFRRDVEWKAELNNKDIVLAAEELEGNGIAPFADIEDAVADYNKKQNNQFAPAPVQYAPAIANQSIQTNPADDTLIQTIQLLYKNATPTQKARIQEWIATQK